MAPKSVRKQSLTDSDSAEGEKGEKGPYRALIDKIAVAPVGSAPGSVSVTEWITSPWTTTTTTRLTLPGEETADTKKTVVSPGVDALRSLLKQEEKHLAACEKAEVDARAKVGERERLTREARERVEVLEREVELLEQFTRMREAGEV